MPRSDIDISPQSFVLAFSAMYTVGMDTKAVNPRLARQLVLDELFDLTLYCRLAKIATNGTARIFKELIPIEERHLAFWEKFFNLHFLQLDSGRRAKLFFVVLFCRVFGEHGIHLALEAIEVHGIKKYLTVWDTYRGTPLGEAVKDILKDELEHEDALVSIAAERAVNPERIRNIFLGLNDGLVELLGAVSGFYAALGTASAVFLASLSVAVAGAISMAAGVFVAVGSEREVENLRARKNIFLGNSAQHGSDMSPFSSGATVGTAYFIGALIPVAPLFFGGRGLLWSALVAGVTIVIVSTIIAFFSGMEVRKRIMLNLVIMVFAVAITYGIGVAAKNILGVEL